ncbi:MAG: hypothetical protein QF662_02770 [Phycisphaerae bacterium]|jgi:alkylhydroperoxidase/carboxymuconolactone decarboxylase family protein YurZ|nr:hypothetical protein [Phycisphaerae bacterium]
MAVKAALDAGASKAEVAEALLLTSYMGACTQLHWAGDVYEKCLAGK